MEVARPKSDRRTLGDVNGITRTVGLSLDFRGLTAQTINECVRMQKVINIFIPTSAEIGPVASVTSVFLM